MYHKFRTRMFFALHVAAIATAVLCAVAQNSWSQTRFQGNQLRDHRVQVREPRVQVRDHRGDGPIVVPPITDPTPPTPPQFGDYSGAFAGLTRIDVRELGLNTKTVATFDMKGKMDLAWLVLRRQMEEQIRFYFEKAPRDHRNRETLESLAGRNLYDLKITMGESSQASLLMSVSTQQKQITLRYSVPNNKLKFRAEVDNFFDPTISISSTINVVVTMKASGDPANPLKVTQAFVEFGNVKASVDGNLIHDVLENFVEFVKGVDFERKIANAINGRRQDITSEVNKGMVLINQKLAEFTAAGYNSLTPGYDRSRHALVLKLSRALPDRVIE